MSLKTSQLYSAPQAKCRAFSPKFFSCWGVGLSLCNPKISASEWGMFSLIPCPSLAATNKQAAALRKLGPDPCLGSIVELTLLAEVWANQSWCCSYGRAVHITHLSCDCLDWVEILHHHLSMPEEGGRACTEVKITGVLSLLFISYKAQETKLYILTKEYSRVGPECVGVREPTQTTRNKENCLYLLAHHC